jgi:serine/threonine protein kinase
VPSTLSPGTRFGSYEILERLGAGGMGEVYRAKDTRLEREVAIKTLSLERFSQPEALSRFEQEARSACALNHPNIVTIYELGHLNGTRYISMELVIGETVRECWLLARFHSAKLSQSRRRLRTLSPKCTRLESFIAI